MPLSIGYHFHSPAGIPERGSHTTNFSSLRFIADELARLDAKLFFVSGTDYASGSHFKKSWAFDDDYGVRPHRPIDLDLLVTALPIEIDSALKVINHPELHRLCADKYLTQRMFPTHHAKTVLVHTSDELPAAIDALPGDIKVLKSTVSSHSRDVRIGDNGYLLANEVPYPAIVEEYLDSSVGIPGITPAEHDLRIVMIESRPSLAMVRVPAAGEYRAGIEFGATSYFPDIELLPDSVKQLTQTIDAEFEVYPGRVYSIDLAMTAEGPKIIELNKAPAVWSSSEDPHVAAFNQKLAQHFVDYASS